MTKSSRTGHLDKDCHAHSVKRITSMTPLLLQFDVHVKVKEDLANIPFIYHPISEISLENGIESWLTVNIPAHTLLSFSHNSRNFSARKSDFQQITKVFTSERFAPYCILQVIMRKYDMWMLCFLSL